MKSAYCQTIIGFAAIVVRCGIASAHFAQELGQTPLGSSGWPSPTSLQDAPKEDGDKLNFWADESDQDELLFLLHRQLVEIDSVTGHEGEIARYLVNLFESHDWKVETQEVTKDRFNVLAYPKAVDQGKSTILVTSHIDTVPPFIPYGTRDGNTTIWGRGSVDAKASVAAQIAASMKLLHPSSGADISPDALSLLFVVGEETSGDGMKHFSAHAPHNYSAVIFGEPTEGKLVCGHKGIIVFNIEVTGKAAHSGYPWLGISANNLLHEALGAMLRLEPQLPYSDKYGPSTLNVGRVEGGVAANVVAEKATAMLAIRLGGGTPEEVQEQVREELEGTRKKAEDNGGSLGIDWVAMGYPPQDMLCDVEGFDRTTVNYGTDVPNLNGTHDRYLFGPGSIFVAHGANEHLNKSDLTGAVDKFEKLIVHALRKEA